MEFVAKLIGIFIFFAVLRLVKSFFSAAVASATNKDASFSDHFKANLTEDMGQFQIRVVEDEFDQHKVWSIQAKGYFPIEVQRDMGFVISVLDVTDDETKPVFSILEDYQEHNSIAFQNIIPIKGAQPGYGYISWTKVGGVIPDFLQAAMSGERKLLVIFRIVDLNNPPSIHLGFHSENDPGIIWQSGVDKIWNMKIKGFIENAQNIEKSELIIIKLALAVAFSDNEFEDIEGEVISKWMKKNLSTVTSDSSREDLKNKYNKTFSDTFEFLEDGNKLLVNDCLSELKEIADDKIKYDAIELCYDVVAADGKIEAEEMEIVHHIAKYLELDFNEIEKIKDSKILSLDTTSAGNVSINDLLGIQDEWSNEQVKKHLRNEFQKWNSRLNTLPEGEERQNAQKMLDLISEARKSLDESKAAA